MKRLVDLDPSWVLQDNRLGMGVVFLCPCCVGTERERYLFAMFRNPLDGGPGANEHPSWERAGDSFETLTLTPSIDASASGHWHGFVTAGTLT